MRHVKAMLVAYLYGRYHFFLMKCKNSRESHCLGSPPGSNGIVTSRGPQISFRLMGVDYYNKVPCSENLSKKHVYYT